MGGARKRKAPLIEDCAVVPLPQDGDCFYKCIARAYASAGLSASDEANVAAARARNREIDLTAAGRSATAVNGRGGGIAGVLQALRGGRSRE